MRGFLKRLGILIGGSLLYSWPIWGLAVATYLSKSEVVFAFGAAGSIGWVMMIVLMEASAIIPHKWSEEDYFFATVSWVLSPFALIILPALVVAVWGYGLYKITKSTLRWLAYG